MKSRNLSNVFAILLLVIGCAGYGYYRSQPPAADRRGPDIRDSGDESTPEESRETSKKKKPIVKHTADARSVTVKVLSKPIVCPEKDVPDKLFGEFANRPEEPQFGDYTAENWRANFDSFAAALVNEAERQKLDAKSLKKVLDLVLSNSGHLAYLPVGAYQANLNARPVWIITVKWEAEDFTRDSYLEHIRVFAYDRNTLEQVGFATCS